jgi:hypothetical protein
MVNGNSSTVNEIQRVARAVTGVRAPHDSRTEAAALPQAGTV